MRSAKVCLVFLSMVVIQAAYVQSKDATTDTEGTAGNEIVKKNGRFYKNLGDDLLNKGKPVPIHEFLSA